MSEINNNDPYRIRDNQLYLLDLLKCLDSFCRSHKINYAIQGGTVLGAVRHGGFIPWDYDIDIAFDRKNYRKFLKAVQEDISDEYVLIEDLWIKRISRADNLGKGKDVPENCIDFFVFDNLPDNPIAAKTKILMILLLQGMTKKKQIYLNTMGYTGY